MATPTATGEGTAEVPAAHLMGSVRRPDQPTSRFSFVLKLNMLNSRSC